MTRIQNIPGVSVRALTVIACLVFTVNAGKIGANIEMHAGDFDNVDAKNIFHVHDHGEGHENETAGAVSGGELGNGTLLDKDESHAAFLETSEPEEYIKITLPREDGEDMTLWLYHTSIFAEGAHVCYINESGEDECEEPGQGKHYWGIVEGHPEDSLAACSLQDSEYACLVSLGEDTFVLGNMGDTGSEVFYNTKDLHASPANEYGTLDNPMFGNAPSISGLEDNTAVTDPCV